MHYFFKNIEEFLIRSILSVESCWKLKHELKRTNLFSTELGVPKVHENSVCTFSTS